MPEMDTKHKNRLYHLNIKYKNRGDNMSKLIHGENNILLMYKEVRYIDDYFNENTMMLPYSLRRVSIEKGDVKLK